MTEKAIQKKEPSIIEIVETKINELQESGGLNFPAKYSPGNALKSAWLELQNITDKDKKPVLESCTKPSIINSLMSMVIQGLNVVKKQGYFIPYGNQLSFIRSYHGTKAVVKRIIGVSDVYAQVIYDGDTFEYIIEKGVKKITNHIQKIENVNLEKILAAYCTILMEDGTEYSEIMTMQQILKSWGKSKTISYGNSTHKEFPDQMAMRTVINRTCKQFVNSSDDSDVIIDAFNKSEEIPYEEITAKEVEDKSNTEILPIIENDDKGEDF